jgi:molybdate/tungstate transport system substrate-binding protein
MARPSCPRTPDTFRLHPGKRALALAATLGLAAAGCGSSANAPPVAFHNPAGVHRGSGSVEVLYAGSLVDLMEQQIDPAFDKATGYSVAGYPAGSKDLASEIKGKVLRGDVFISASPSVNDTLEGSANGNWVSWYLEFASSPLVIGYNPHSAFAAALRTKPWYQVLADKGILIGRTDPATDPKGRLSVDALDDAAATHHEPALAALAGDSADVFPEETLVGRLQSGQLDVGFFYSSEAKAAGIPTVALSGLNLRATYTVTVINHAPDPAGAQAFVEFLLGPGGRAALSQDAFDLVVPPQLSGSGLPKAIEAAISVP